MEFLGYDLKGKQVDPARRPKTARGALLAGKSLDTKTHLVASVIATTGEPDVNDYINLLGAVTDHIRETGDAQTKGVIIYNSQFEVPTAERREPFDGNEDILENLQTQNAGVLTGWTLFKLVQDIKGGLLTREEARRELENSGLIIHASESLKGEGEPKMAAARPTLIIRQEKPEARPPEPPRKVEPIRFETPPAAPVKPPEPPRKVEIKIPEPTKTEEPKPEATPLAAPKLDIKPLEPIQIEILKPAIPTPEPPIVEAPKIETETLRAEVKPPEPPKVETEPPEVPKVETPRAEVEPPEFPRAEVKPTEPPKVEAPTAAMPMADPRAPEARRAEAPKAEAEKKEPEKEQPPKKEGKMDYNKVVRKLLKWE